MLKDCPVCCSTNKANGREGNLDRYRCPKCCINYYVQRETVVKQVPIKGIPKKGYK